MVDNKKRTKERRPRRLNPIHRDLFQAIHEGKWLTIEYQNKKD